MSKVDHPAHYGGGENPYEVIKVLRMWLSPTEFLGFLKGNVLKYTARANAKGGVEDHEKALWYGRHIVSFIHDQRADGEPDGLAVEALFWTDQDPDLQDTEDEVLACAPTLHPFLLCSSVEPHARWAVIFCSEDKTPSFFQTRDMAQEACNEAVAEGQRQRAEVIAAATDLVACGDCGKAGDLCDEFGIDYSLHPNGAIEINGRTVRPPTVLPLDDSASRPDDGA